MFRAVKVKNPKLIVIALLCAILVIAICALMLRIGAPDTVDIDGRSFSLRAEDDGDIEAFLSACGYPDAELLTDTEIVIPKIWNGVYEDYNELQRCQGFDLVPYKGKSARQLIYSADSVCPTVLIYDSAIIAGHSCDPDGSHLSPLIP